MGPGELSLVSIYIRTTWASLSMPVHDLQKLVLIMEGLPVVTVRVWIVTECDMVAGY